MILDSCFLIDLLEGDEEAILALDQYAKEHRSLAVSTLTVMEVAVGLSESSAETFERTMDQLDSVPFELGMAHTAASLQRDLRASGNQIGTVDAMIAATALQGDGVVVTRNVDEFDRITGVSVESY